MYEYHLTVTAPRIALGNGDRQRGDVLAVIECEHSAESLLDLALLVQFNELPGTVSLSDGVEAGEVMTALRNPHLISLDSMRDPIASSDDNTPTEDDGETLSVPGAVDDAAPQSRKRRR